jgi:RimJ/RimL family protein N-acetyltransferase
MPYRDHAHGTLRIETDRLLLRPLTTADLDEVVEMHAMPEVVRTMGPYDRPAALARLERNEHEWAGWALRPDVWGQGFATEAGRACIDWGFGRWRSRTSPR